MKIAIPNPVRIDGELVAATSLEGTELRGGMIHYQDVMQELLTGRTRLV